MPLPVLFDRLFLALGLRRPRLAEIVSRLRAPYDDAASPHELFDLPDFRAGVAWITGRLRAGDAIEPYVFTKGPIVALMAAEAAAGSGDETESAALLVRALAAEGWPWTRHRVLEILAEREGVPVLARVLTTLPPLEEEQQARMKPFLTRLARARAQCEINESFGDRFERLDPSRRQFAVQLVEQLATVLPPALVREARLGSRRDVPAETLNSIGRIWDPLPDESEDLECVTDSSMESSLASIESELRAVDGRSVLLVGESGTGKTALIREVGRRLQRSGWVIFEASATELIAGQSFIGQIEGRLRALFQALSGRDVLWIVPSFHELAYSGATMNDPTAVLEQMIPWIDRGALRLLGETQPAALEHMLLRTPRVRTAMTIARIEPLDDAGTLRLAATWCERAARRDRPICDEPTLREASQLARQYLGNIVQPGSLLKLLRLTSDRLGMPGRVIAGPIGVDDFLDTLVALTGLPRELLDDRQHLALDGLRAHFEKRVLGQPEAVDRVVERVAMLKAGVTDPRRPVGVFLFVGPTGTGKTEIARTLAEFLFGSSDRMIRLDMSEFQTPESIDGILGDRDPVASTQALVHRIRRQPFSVVLLDEFEKAHSRVWDLFLQVFDDGRLTDRRGHTADFRHAIVILTSNLGAAIPAGTRLGFQPGSDGYAPRAVLRMIDRTFRREFVNRLDHVVVFRPLSRSVMRNIIRKELADVFQRRGLRSREWAVEWDDSAIEFLLDKGFTTDLGARPLRRAIELYLLAPLATTIVRHEVPAGDQFLFVRAEGGAIQVRFVDPDAPDPEIEGGRAIEAEPALSTPMELDLRDLVLEARGTAAELALLRTRLERLESVIGSDMWQSRGSQAYAAMQAEGFWRTPGRFLVLGQAENLDRVRAALETARSLHHRLATVPTRERVPTDVLRAMAQQIYLIEAAVEAIDAGQCWEAFLSVRPLATDEDLDAAAVFTRRLIQMYEAWSAKRRMRLDVLDAGVRDGRWIAAVSGFAAWSILRGEHGVHVNESEGERDRIDRLRVEVRVAPQPPEPAATRAALLEQARTALAAAGDATSIIRRYRDGAAPLVRDSVRGFRTGRVDRVYAGHFDVLR